MVALRKQEAASGQVDDHASSQPLQRKVPIKPLEDAVLLQIVKRKSNQGVPCRISNLRKGNLSFRILQNRSEMSSSC